MSGARVIYAATAAVLVVIAIFSLVLNRTSERDAVRAFASSQVAVARTVAVAIDTELRSFVWRLRQLNTLPSIQSMDGEFIGQRIGASFEGDDSGVIQQIVRIDAGGRLAGWSPRGVRLAEESGAQGPGALWAWYRDPANRPHARLDPVWWDAEAPASLRVLSTPVWRSATSTDLPSPPNDFNGMLAFVVDVERLAQTYARLVPNVATGGTFVLDFGGGQYIVQIPRGGATLAADVTAVLARTAGTPEGSRVDDDVVVAWSRIPVHEADWTVLLSTPYAAAAGERRGISGWQLALIAALLLSVPVVGWVLVQRERRAEEERQALQLQLSQAQKMDAIGKLAGGVAHDFNNLLTAILGYVSLILEDTPAGSTVHEEASQIKRAAESAAMLTQKLLAFSRRQILQPTQIDVGALLGEVVPLIKRVIGEQINLSSAVDPALWRVVADPVQIEQALINLAINSRDAMPEGGDLTIEARNAPRPHGERRADHVVPAGDYVQIVVRDTGAGMNEATRARMFEPFFTTKPKGKGTGLGLSTVYGMVKQSGGFINVISAPGAGTTIELLFPRATASAAEPAPKAENVEPTARGHETILLVEDDPAVRELARTSLERHGYHVLAAPNADDAVRIASNFRGTISLLLTDVVMPGMQGPELAETLRGSSPGLRVLFMTGYAGGQVTAEMLKNASLLMKPFSAAVLSRAVRQALDPPSA